MKVFYNKNFPCEGYIFNLFGVLFARKGAVVTEKTENHEMIHCYQMVEVGLLAGGLLAVLIPLCGWSWWWMATAIPAFYIWYGVEWFYQWVWSWFNGTIDAYKMVTFEQEAYANDQDLSYRSGRKWFAWVGYMFSRVIYS